MKIQNTTPQEVKKLENELVDATQTNIELLEEIQKEELQYTYIIADGTFIEGSVSNNTSILLAPKKYDRNMIYDCRKKYIIMEDLDLTTYSRNNNIVQKIKTNLEKENILDEIVKDFDVYVIETNGHLLYVSHAANLFKVYL